MPHTVTGNPYIFSQDTGFIFMTNQRIMASKIDMALFAENQYLYGVTNESFQRDKDACCGETFYSGNLNISPGQHFITCSINFPYSRSVVCD